jgi:rubrerythrin
MKHLQGSKMKTTQQWLSEVKASPDKLTHWLQRQYIGEALAAERIQSLADVTNNRNKHLLERIAHDEVKHCEWVAELLTARGIKLPVATYEGMRYWEPILQNLHTFSEIAGAGHHAEAMRLVRIKALASDIDIDEDIRNVFAKILPDEEMHSKAFASMSTADAIETTRLLHSAGLDLLGLEM